MSIWCSWPHIGTDPTVMYEAAPGLYEVNLGDGEQARGRTADEAVAQRGNVLSYAEGFSNHYPDLTGTHERPAVVALAVMPPWCVPDYGDTGEPVRVSAGPWLRLEVAAPHTLNFWLQDPSGSPAVEDRRATVVLDEQAVRSLVGDLNDWLARVLVRPK